MTGLEQQAVAVVVGVASSLAASTLWLFWLRRLRPNLALSPVITEETRELGGSHHVSYSIKLINRGRRAAVDLGFELTLIRPRRTKGGFVDARRLLEVRGRPPLLLPGYHKALQDPHKNAYRLRTDAALRQLLADGGAHIRLRVFAKDELSGIGQVFEASFHDPTSEIKRGKFARGQTFEVVDE